VSRAPRRGGNQGRRPPGRRPAPLDVWRNPGELPETEPIAISTEPAALLRSLGDPPMHDGADAAKYFAKVVQRAATIATALALSADLLATVADD
jgi:hypothetical protein